MKTSDTENEKPAKFSALLLDNRRRDQKPTETEREKKTSI